MRKTMVILCMLALAGCADEISDNPADWTCEGLIKAVIAMSQDRSPVVLEIANPVELRRDDGPDGKIECRADAEWSEGQGYIDYSAYVSDGGGIYLQYGQR